MSSMPSRTGKRVTVDSVELGADFWPHRRRAHRARHLPRRTPERAQPGVSVVRALRQRPHPDSLDRPHRGRLPDDLELRNRGSLEETPIDAPSARRSSGCAGGIALIGVDWPVPVEAAERTVFLAARPARRVLRADGAGVRTQCLCRSPAGRRSGATTPAAAPHLEMERTGDRERDIQHNVRRMLSVVEAGFARPRPGG